MKLRYLAVSFVAAYGLFLALAAMTSGDGMLITGSPLVWFVIGAAQASVIVVILYWATHHKDWPGGVRW
jgi:hypothetical protein